MHSHTHRWTVIAGTSYSDYYHNLAPWAWQRRETSQVGMIVILLCFNASNYLERARQFWLKSDSFLICALKDWETNHAVFLWHTHTHTCTPTAKMSSLTQNVFTFLECQFWKHTLTLFVRLSKDQNTHTHLYITGDLGQCQVNEGIKVSGVQRL